MWDYVVLTQDFGASWAKLETNPALRQQLGNPRPRGLMRIYILR